jgi:hypothetical protein
MTKKTSIKTATWTDLDEIRSSLPGISLDDARAMLHASRERFLSSDELATHHKAHTDTLAKRSHWSSFKDATTGRESFAAPVFAAAAVRRSKDSSDHTLRLSNSRNDSAAMKKFLESGSVTVIPTRKAPGTKTQKIRVKFASPVSSTVKSQKAHAKVSRDAAAARRS